MTILPPTDLTTEPRNLHMPTCPQTNSPFVTAARALARPVMAMALATALPLALAACGDSSPNASSAGKGSPSAKDTSHHDHGHAHDHDGSHDHSGDAPKAPETPASPEASEPATAEGGAGLPKGLMLSRRPIGAVGVTTARMGVRPGEPISLIGRIGGSRSPIVSSRAVFTIVDPELKCCLETSDEDHCPRPWDYCCSDRAQLAAAMATIEICGPDGKALALSLEKEGTLRPLTLIAVNGVLEAPDGSGSFVVRARGIYLMPNDPLADRIGALRK